MRLRMPLPGLAITARERPLSWASRRQSELATFAAPALADRAANGQKGTKQPPMKAGAPSVRRLAFCVLGMTGTGRDKKWTCEAESFETRRTAYEICTHVRGGVYKKLCQRTSCGLYLDLERTILGGRIRGRRDDLSPSVREIARKARYWPLGIKKPPAVRPGEQLLRMSLL